MSSRLGRERIVGAVIGTEVGAATGLLLLGGVPFAPLVTTVAGAAVGAAAAAPALRVRERLIRHALRRRLRAASQG